MEQLPTTDQRRNSTLDDPTSDGSGQSKSKGKGQKKAKEKGGAGEGVGWCGVGGNNCLLAT